MTEYVSFYPGREHDNIGYLAGHLGFEAAANTLIDFAYHPGMQQLAEATDATISSTDVAGRLGELAEIAAERWDFRKGAERQAIDWNIAGLDEPGNEVGEKVLEAGEQLGMIRSGELTNTQPTYLTILGGANKSALDRLRFGLESVYDFDHVVYPGSSRPIATDTERAAIAGYAPYAKTEYDLGSGAFEKLLNARLTQEITTERDGDTWGTRVYEFEHNGRTKNGFVLSTPRMIDGHRATTYDNFRFLADRAELADYPDATIAVVTTGHYVPAQHFAAVQTLTLPYGTSVETIGHSADYSGVVRKPSQILQEAKSAVDAAVRLHQELA